ncbi:MAG: efflux transporter outer membrane subunit [Parvibaculum sp.]|nr:efflux transporter outer membrane subunit [Parvibaculum sp.]
MKVPFSVSLAILLTACSMVPDYERPAVEMPAAWSVAEAEGARAADAAWWRNFGDAELDALMTAALAANLDIVSALARIEQSQGALRASGASLLPNVSGSGSGASRAIDGGPSRESASIGLTASYALDLWGRYRAQADAARASIDATVFDRDATLLMVQSQVAVTYFNILNAKDRLAIAEESLTAARETYRIAEARYNAGSTSALDIAQQRNNIANIEAGIPPLERDVAANQHALAILLGRAPPGFAVAGSSTAHLALPDIATGQPAALLERRPDIRRAEAQLIAANADIGAARAAFFPSLDISASATRSFATAAPAETATSLAASLLAPIFSGGSLEGNLQSARGRQAELAANYQKAVLTSFGEVEDALASADANARREALLTSAAAEARRAYDLSEARYRAGASDLLSVLDAQRAWLSARDSAAQARLNRYSSAVDLFVALGGGWES